MAESKKMHMVADTYYDESGLNVLYGPGELHEPGSLPEGVTYREVLADDAQMAAAPVHAQAKDPVAEQGAKRAEFEKLQTERNPAPGEPLAAADPAGDSKPADEPAKAQPAKTQGKPGTGGK